MKQRILLFAFLLIGNLVFSQKIVAENYCKIFFGEGFGRTQSDSIHFIVNNIVVHENQGLYSLSYGSSPGRILVIRLKNELIACTTDDYPEKISYLGKIKKRNLLEIKAVFRGDHYQFNIDLTKGKFIIFDARFEGKLEYSQHLKPPRFS